MVTSATSLLPFAPEQKSAYVKDDVRLTFFDPLTGTLCPKIVQDEAFVVDQLSVENAANPAYVAGFGDAEK